MIPYERKKEILQLLENADIVTLEDFCDLLNDVSESTIRRDLKTLEKEGHIELLRGGAAKLKGGYYDTPVTSRNQINVEEKELIAQKAACMVNDGDVVYIDAGSTPLMMVKYLIGKKITIVTTNTEIGTKLMGSDIECILVGGKLDVRTASVYGGMTIQSLQQLFFDKAFLGASGFSMKAGINTPELEEVKKKQIVRHNSRKTYVLADSSKDGKETMCKIFEMGEVKIICDRETDTLKECGNYIIA